MLKKKDPQLTETHDPEIQRSSQIQLDWLGQMIASILWATSVFVYGITSTGDLLQLCAALAWMAANVSVLLRTQRPN